MFCFTCQGKSFTWRSQPYILGRYPAGNVLLSFAVLMAGASISKVLLVFRHLGLAAYSPRNFFYHQSKFIFPTILLHWESYQRSLIQSLRTVGETVWCGDGRFDSMGHSAKYGAYTMFCTTILKIVHFDLLQVGISHPSINRWQNVGLCSGYFCQASCIVTGKGGGGEVSYLCSEMLYNYNVKLFYRLTKLGVAMQWNLLGLRLVLTLY